jgi:DNA relaxase NicK
MIERFIDYLQFSANFREINAIENKYKPIRPVAFYERGYLGEFGIRYYFGNPNSSKALCILSGETLAVFRDKGYQDATILEWAFEYGAKVSRLDLAVTEWIGETLFTVADVEQWYLSKQFSGSLVKYGAKKISSYDDDNGERPETFYIGDMSKRGKLGIFRAYNKGLQLNLGDYMATRIELEMRGDKAHNNAVRICKTNDVAGNFRASLDCQNETFERLMESPVADISRGDAKAKLSEDEKMESRWEWLLSQVAPALREAIEDERKKDPATPKLTAFLYESGLISEMREGANLLAFWDKMRDTENQV